MKQEPAFKTLPLVENPTAIRVLAINQRLLEQLPYLDGVAGGPEKTPDWDNYSIVGLTTGGTIVVKGHGGGRLAKVRGMAFIQWAMENGRTNAQANAEMLALPQVFTA